MLEPILRKLAKFIFVTDTQTHRHTDRQQWSYRTFPYGGPKFNIWNIFPDRLLETEEDQEQNPEALPIRSLHIPSSTHSEKLSVFCLTDNFQKSVKSFPPTPFRLSLKISPSCHTLSKKANLSWKFKNFLSHNRSSIVSLAGLAILIEFPRAGNDQWRVERKIKFQVWITI